MRIKRQHLRQGSPGEVLGAVRDFLLDGFSGLQAGLPQIGPSTVTYGHSSQLFADVCRL